eukprot:12246206-Heterocapsa_arctica.AAC.1
MAREGGGRREGIAREGGGCQAEWLGMEGGRDEWLGREEGRLLSDDRAGIKPAARRAHLLDLAVELLAILKLSIILLLVIIIIIRRPPCGVERVGTTPKAM